MSKTRSFAQQAVYGLFFSYQETPDKEDTGLPQSGDEWIDWRIADEGGDMVRYLS